MRETMRNQEETKRKLGETNRNHERNYEKPRGNQKEQGETRGNQEGNKINQKP